MVNTTMKALPLLLFWALGIIWGSNFIYMKWASDYVTSSQVVILRVAFGFLPVLIYAAIRKDLHLSHSKHTAHFFVMSLLATVVYYFGFVKGSALLHSGIAGALSGSIPIFSFVLALMFLPEEKSSIRKITGIFLGFAGIVIIANPFAGNIEGSNVHGVLYMIMGSLSVGASFIYAKKFISPLKIPSSALTTYQLGLALVILLVFSDVQGIERVFDDTHVAIGVILGLGILGTGLAYVIYYYLIDKLGAVAASSVTYIPPIVALAIGSVLVGEEILFRDYLATVLIFCSITLINQRISLNLKWFNRS